MNQQPTQLLLNLRTESIKLWMLSIPNYFVKNKFYLFDFINLIIAPLLCHFNVRTYWYERQSGHR